jgi:hypothetical protein
VLNLFDSGSSVFEGETTALEPPQKCSRKSPPPKDIPKPSVVKGTFECFFFLCFCFENYDVESFRFDTTMVVSPSTGATKGSSGKDVCTVESPSLSEPPAEVEDALAHETIMLDIVLASGHRLGH